MVYHRIFFKGYLQKSETLLYFLWFYLFTFGYYVSLLLFRLFSSCSNWGLLSSWAVWASHCGGFSCCRAWALGHVGLRSCGAQAYLPHGKWNLLRLGIKSMSPTLAGGFLITGPVGKSTLVYIWSLWWLSKISPVCMNSPHRTWFHISSLPWSFSQWMCLYLFGSLLKCSVQTNSNILNVVYV